jgi:hypothetical protein
VLGCVIDVARVLTVCVCVCLYKGSLVSLFVCLFGWQAKDKFDT